MMLLFTFCVSTLLGATSLAVEDGPVIETTLGPVMGRYAKSYEGRTYLAFEGIPYAKPPVGDLRFKGVQVFDKQLLSFFYSMQEPQPADPWTKTLIANTTYECIQYTYILPMKSATGNEDCLYLYVYVPTSSITGKENLDVVVHIHGGAFIVGDPKSLAGPDYIMDRDVVYVSMNYRLGILGFLSTEDEVVSGNNGLKDQTFALQWVRDNIKLFGGNPDSVTITGSSAGGACVHHHYLSPLSKGLFHRGFSQSGTALNVWALTKHPLQNAMKLGRLFNCSTASTKAIVDCLRGFPAKEVTAALGEFFVFSNALPSNPFAPVVEYGEAAFLPDHPHRLLTEGRFNDYPWITSNTIQEGIIPVGFFVLFKKLPELDQHWDELSPYTLAYYDTASEENKAAITATIRKHYFGNATISMENIFEHIKMYTDRFFLVDAEKAARLQAKVAKSPVYYYLFEHLIDMPIIFKANLPVVGHGDDFRILFREKHSPEVLSENDRKIKDIFIDLLYSFATTGKPTIMELKWNPVPSTGDKMKYMRISSTDKIRMESDNQIGDAAFWDSLPLKENERLL